MTSYGQAFLYRLDEPGDRDRAKERLHADFAEAAVAHNFPDYVYDTHEGRIGDGWAYIAWHYDDEVPHEE